MQLLKTIYALLSIKVPENSDAFSSANQASLPLLSTKDCKLVLAPKTAVFMVDHHFRGLGAIVKNALLRSLNLIQLPHTRAEYDNEPPYTALNQPASYYDTTLYMLSVSCGEPRHTGRHTRAYFSF